MEIDFIHGKKKNTLFYKRGVIMRVISGIVEIKSDGRDALNVKHILRHTAATKSHLILPPYRIIGQIYILRQTLVINFSH
jgi:hypothetical protein